MKKTRLATKLSLRSEVIRELSQRYLRPIVGGVMATAACTVTVVIKTTQGTKE